MKLSDLLKGIDFRCIDGDIDVEIVYITEDSRSVAQGYVFVAINGDKTNGHEYIEQAIKNGAVAIVCQELPQNINNDITYIVVENSYKALACMANNYYGCPSKDMKVVGVTGTNGKTTIATLLYRLHMLAGHKSGLISTVCNYIGDREVKATHTTPGAIELQRLMREMADDGCRYVFMEVSSHACHQFRIHGIDFDGAIFTNLTRDHLDYHKTVDNYLNAKKMFFDDLKREAFALTNIDEKTGNVMLQNTKAKKVTYSLHSLSDFHARILENHIDSTLVSINDKDVVIRLLGEFNVYNILAVYASSVLLGMDKDEALGLLSMLTPVSGRFQTFISKRKYTVIVDYAHTPDALKNVLSTIKSIAKNGNIITVVGCGGDRDKGKRPIMAKVSLDNSDKVIFTSDNPRTENPDDIINDMKCGIEDSLLSKSISITNRKEAIKTACMLAKSGDVILIAGKGHETYQEINGVKYDFDDREIVKEIFNNEK